MLARAIKCALNGSVPMSTNGSIIVSVEVLAHFVFETVQWHFKTALSSITRDTVPQNVLKSVAANSMPRKPKLDHFI